MDHVLTQNKAIWGPISDSTANVLCVCMYIYIYIYICGHYIYVYIHDYSCSYYLLSLLVLLLLSLSLLLLLLGRGHGTDGKCTGPEWSKMVQSLKRPFWSKWPYPEPDFSIRETKWTKMVHLGPFRSANRTLAIPDMCVYIYTHFISYCNTCHKTWMLQLHEQTVTAR